MFMYEKDNKLNLTFEKTVVPPETPDLVISKEDGITTVSIEGQTSSLPQVTEENNGQTLVVQDGQWVLGQGGSSASNGFLNNNPGSVTLPSDLPEDLYFQCFQAKNISEAIITEAIDISGQLSLAGNYSLNSVKIETEDMCTLGTDALVMTSIEFGWIYVPDSLVDTYKAATNWSNYSSRIVGLSEYPKEITITETITDSWEDIFASEEDGTYSTKYQVGGTKVLDINGTKAIMQIVAFDTDVLANGGNAKISWLCKNIPYIFQMNPQNYIDGGWADCSVRKVLRGPVYNDIPEVIKNNIKEVNKTYYDAKASETKIIIDTLFTPSAKEVAASVSPMEDSGVVYSDIFSDNNSRIKNIGLTSAASLWWLRSSSSGRGDFFRSVIGSGGISGGEPSLLYGVSFGFCT